MASSRRIWLGGRRLPSLTSCSSPTSLGLLMTSLWAEGGRHEDNCAHSMPSLKQEPTSSVQVSAGSEMDCLLPSCPTRFSDSDDVPSICSVWFSSKTLEPSCFLLFSFLYPLRLQNILSPPAIDQPPDNQARCPATPSLAWLIAGVSSQASLLPPLPLIIPPPSRQNLLSPSFKANLPAVRSPLSHRQLQLLPYGSSLRLAGPFSASFPPWPLTAVLALCPPSLPGWPCSPQKVGQSEQERLPP